MITSYQQSLFDGHHGVIAGNTEVIRTCQQDDIDSIALTTYLDSPLQATQPIPTFLALAIANSMQNLPTTWKIKNKISMFVYCVYVLQFL